MNAVLRGLGWLLVVPMVAVSGVVVGVAWIGTSRVSSVETVASAIVEQGVPTDVRVYLLDTIEKSAGDDGRLELAQSVDDRWIGARLIDAGTAVDTAVKVWRETGQEPAVAIMVGPVLKPGVDQGGGLGGTFEKEVVLIDEGQGVVAQIGRGFAVRDTARTVSILALGVGLAIGWMLLGSGAWSRLRWVAWASLWIGIGTLGFWLAAKVGVELLWGLSGADGASTSEPILGFGKDAVNGVVGSLVDPTLIWIFVAWGIGLLSVVAGAMFKESDRKQRRARVIDAAG